jgi:uncharacterized membrane protein YjjP (DUF1212 family)
MSSTQRGQYAVLRNRVDIVKALLQSGAEVNAKDS